MALAFVFVTNKASAVTGADWRAGSIIDDGIFYNNNDMSVTDIQNFLNSKVTCDTWGSKPSEWGGGTRAQYGASKGYPAPYTCLKDYSQDGKSAAQIIKDAANTYQISTRALIVLLQKEQALVTDEWPWAIQYRSATGYGCPDTAPCDAEYYGFKNQVMKAAYQFRRYASYPSEYRYKPYQNNTIQFNPNAGCGSTNVYIENLATAGLYNYTPYQPNQSALNNLYGSGNSCGAYGNRNFWRLFNDWFNSTQIAPYQAAHHTQSPFNEPLYPGESRSVYFEYRNIGATRWYDDTSAPSGYNPIHLAATNPINKSSIFSYGWPSSGRPNLNFTKVFESNGVTLATNQHVVEPGQIARFEFTLTPPWNTPRGNYREFFQPVIEGASQWSMGGLAWFDFSVD